MFLSEVPRFFNEDEIGEKTEWSKLCRINNINGIYTVLAEEIVVVRVEKGHSVYTHDKLMFADYIWVAKFYVFCQYLGSLLDVIM